jgi:hypothetical protein
VLAVDDAPGAAATIPTVLARLLGGDVVAVHRSSPAMSTVPPRALSTRGGHLTHSNASPPHIGRVELMEVVELVMKLVDELRVEARDGVVDRGSVSEARMDLPEVAGTWQLVVGSWGDRR